MRCRVSAESVSGGRPSRRDRALAAIGSVWPTSRHPSVTGPAVGIGACEWVRPPATTISCPVTHDVASENRYRTAPAMSSGRPMQSVEPLAFSELVSIEASGPRVIDVEAALVVPSLPQLVDVQRSARRAACRRRRTSARNDRRPDAVRCGCRFLAGRRESFRRFGGRCRCDRRAPVPSRSADSMAASSATHQSRPS